MTASVRPSNSTIANPRPRGAIETAKRVRQRISGVFVFAIAKGIAQSDPAEKLGAVPKPLRKGRRPRSRSRSATDDDHVAEKDYGRPITRLGLRFPALRAVRPSERRSARFPPPAPAFAIPLDDDRKTGRHLGQGERRRRGAQIKVS